MKTTRATIITAGLAALAACGATKSDAGAGSGQNQYTGTITITGALPVGTTACQGTTVVRFVAGGGEATPHAVPVVGGGCVQFLNQDAAPHRPAPRTTNACAALNGAAVGGLLTGESFTTAPLGSAAASQTCDWMDSLNPPGTGGGGGGY